MTRARQQEWPMRCFGPSRISLNGPTLTSGDRFSSPVREDFPLTVSGLRGLSRFSPFTSTISTNSASTGLLVGAQATPLSSSAPVTPPVIELHGRGHNRRWAPVIRCAGKAGPIGILCEGNFRCPLLAQLGSREMSALTAILMSGPRADIVTSKRLTRSRPRRRPTERSSRAELTTRRAPTEPFVPI